MGFTLCVSVFGSFVVFSVFSWFLDVAFNGVFVVLSSRVYFFSVFSLWCFGLVSFRRGFARLLGNLSDRHLCCKSTPSSDPEPAMQDFSRHHGLPERGTCFDVAEAGMTFFQVHSKLLNGTLCSGPFLAKRHLDVVCKKSCARLCSQRCVEMDLTHLVSPQVLMTHPETHIHRYVRDRPLRHVHTCDLSVGVPSNAA